MAEGICGVTAAPGRVAYGSLEFEGMKVPVVVARGRADGPTLLVAGLQHATEFSGPAAVDGALEMLDLGALRGTLLCLPVTNPIQLNYSFEQHSAAHKKPETNLNRQWPGDASSPNQFSRLAALLWKEALARSSALIDFHCCRIIDPRFAAAAEGHAPSEALARAVRLDAVDLQTAASYARGLLFIHAAQDLGIPAILVESYPGGFQIREAAEACTAVIMRALVHLGMLDRWEPQPRHAPESPAVFRRGEKATEIRSRTEGYVAPRLWAGDRVAKGQAVGVIRSLETFAVVEELVSPIDAGVACVGDPAGGGLVKADVGAAIVKQTV